MGFESEFEITIGRWATYSEWELIPKVRASMGLGSISQGDD